MPQKIIIVVIDQILNFSSCVLIKRAPKVQHRHRRFHSTILDELIITLQWRHNGRDSVSNHQPYDCLPNRLFRCISKKTSKLRATGFCVGNSPGPLNSPHKWPVTRKMFPLMASSWITKLWWKRNQPRCIWSLNLTVCLIYMNIYSMNHEQSRFSLDESI